MFNQDSQIAALRKTERQRFERWFVETPLGTAYIDRAGRPRRVSHEELSAWRAEAYARIEEMLAELPKNMWIAVGAMVGVAIIMPMLFSALGIEGLARKVGLAIAFVVIEGGLVGLEAVDYFARWRRQRDAMEQAVAGRAPLAIDPALAKPARSWTLIAQFAIGAIAIFLYLAMHLDGEQAGWINWNYVLLLVPLAYLLYFAGRLVDWIAKQSAHRR